MANELVKKRVTFEEVESNAKNAPRAGSTTDINTKLQSYIIKYTGVMFYASTQNMEKSENKL